MDLIIGLIVERLIKRAIRKLGAEQRDRCEEEWSAHIRETPGAVGKLIAAIGFLRAARTIPGPSGARVKKLRWRALAKWVEDQVLGTLLIIFLAPLMTATALLIKFDSRGPVFFIQERFGFNNRVIKVLKFRTMYINRGDQSGAQPTIYNDPRVTRVGRVIRTLGIDELPQLVNVLCGDMSLSEVLSYIPLYEAGTQWDRIIDSRASAWFYSGILNILTGLVVGITVGKFLL
jgi:hypothetical protein